MNRKLVDNRDIGEQQWQVDHWHISTKVSTKVDQQQLVYGLEQSQHLLDEQVRQINTDLENLAK